MNHLRTLRWVALASFTLVACGGPGGEDAGQHDSGALDAGTLDAGRPDAGLKDAGVLDAGSDAGTPDAGTPDAGTPDAGRRQGIDVSIHTTLGLADDATPGDLRHWLVVKPQYVVSFDTQTKIPNWVAWQLTTDWEGDAGRCECWKTDPAVPMALQARNASYDNSGYERGHMCPSEDRTANPTDNEETFRMINAVPQLGTLNNGTWKQLETEGRQLAAAGKTVFVTSGPLREWAFTLDAGPLIPSATWKVMVVLDHPGNAQDVTEATRVIAVIMPNDGGTSGDWTGYRTSVREIESRTGLDLLSDVDASVQAAIEVRVDDGGML